MPFRTEEAIAGVTAGREDELTAWVVDFRPHLRRAGPGDHALFVEAFRGGVIPAAASELTQDAPGR